MKTKYIFSFSNLIYIPSPWFYAAVGIAINLSKLTLSPFLKRRRLVCDQRPAEIYYLY
jgi:hypothetical protein